MLQLGHSVEEAPWFDIDDNGCVKNGAFVRSLACSLVVGLDGSLGVVASAAGGAGQSGCGCMPWLRCVALAHERLGRFARLTALNC